MSLFDFDNPGEKPISLNIPLPFSDEDKRMYPWLADDIRYYRLEEELGRGGYSVAYRGFPCDHKGIRIDGTNGPITIVAKLPNLVSGYLSGATDIRLRSMNQKSIEEWELTRRKLLPSQHANTIFDVGRAWTQRTAIDEVPITVQLFLSDADPLKKWLENQRLKPKDAFDDDGKEVDNWRGISNWDSWLNLVTVVAEGLVDIHQRRVIHGDIWPPNIYITHAQPSAAVFIDFGESFGFTPNGDAQLQGPHPYRAPERDRPEYVPTEQVDVYSFGKLMLYLATGKDIVIPSGNSRQRLLYGHERRTFLRDSLIERNRSLIKAKPELLDLISQCTELDPVCRPSMLEVLDQLRTLTQTYLVHSVPKLSRRLEELSTAISTVKPNNIFLGFIEKKVADIERLLSTVETEMVEITGTRDVLLSSLVGLFGELGERDSWTTLTTPSVWQANALGLDGRYATATIKAIRRKATVQRTYAFSVEELGSQWTKAFIDRLRANGNETLLRLGDLLEPEVNQFEADEKNKLVAPGSTQFIVDHRQRFKLVVHSLIKMADLYDIGKHIWTGDSGKIEEMAGLYLGMKPVRRLSDIQRLRSRNPLSVMHLTPKTNSQERWFLVMTDVRGRNETERHEGGDDSPIGSSSAPPQLRKVRVFQSVLGVPKNHILVFEDLMKSSVNIGPVLADLSACIESTKV